MGKIEKITKTTPNAPDLFASLPEIARRGDPRPQRPRWSRLRARRGG